MPTARRSVAWDGLSGDLRPGVPCGDPVAGGIRLRPGGVGHLAQCAEGRRARYPAVDA